MANVHRWRKSDPKRVIRMPVDTAEVIEVGDLIWNNVDAAEAASQFTYVTGDLDGTQANFTAKFLGVAMDRSDDGDTADIAIATAGTFIFDCASATFEMGDVVGVDDNGGATALLDQQVIGLGENDSGAIGRIVQRYPNATTSVKIELFQRAWGPAVPINLGQHTIGTADEFVTNLALLFPFKAMRLETIVTTVTGAGAEVLSLDKNATALDDTLTIAAAAPVGALDTVDLIDATGDDLFLVGDTISLSGDGGTASGAVSVTLWVRPFNMQVA